MQSLFKFSDYDIFAYIVAGLALMIGADIVLGWEVIVRRDGDLSLGEGAVRLMVAYVLGLLLAAPSSFVLQRMIEHRIVGQPFGSLMRTDEAKGWRVVFGSFHIPVSPAVRKEIADRLKKLPGWKDQNRSDDPKDDKRVPVSDLDKLPGSFFVTSAWLKAAEAIFPAAHPAAVRDSIASERMEMFLKLYGLCRNLAFVLMLCAIGFVVLSLCEAHPIQLGGKSSSGGGGVTVLVVPTDAAAARVSDATKPPEGCKPFAPTQKGVASCAPLPPHWLMALGTSLVAVLLFLRFLYFHRLYALEVLNAYAREKAPTAAPSPSPIVIQLL
jgi:hypothetical protein